MKITIHVSKTVEYNIRTQFVSYKAVMSVKYEAHKTHIIHYIKHTYQVDEKDLGRINLKMCLINYILVTFRLLNRILIIVFKDIWLEQIKYLFCTENNKL